MLTSGFTGMNQWGVALRGSILSPGKKAEAAAAAPYTVDQNFPSARSAQSAKKFQSQRKIRCNRSDYSSSKRFLDQLLSGNKGNAYRPTILQAYNVGDQLLVPS
jgi:hypothetical protein